MRRRIYLRLTMVRVIWCMLSWDASDIYRSRRPINCCMYARLSCYINSRRIIPTAESLDHCRCLKIAVTLILLKFHLRHYWSYSVYMHPYFKIHLNQKKPLFTCLDNPIFATDFQDNNERLRCVENRNCLLY